MERNRSGECRGRDRDRDWDEEGEFEERGIVMSDAEDAVHVEEVACVTASCSGSLSMAGGVGPPIAAILAAAPSLATPRRAMADRRRICAVGDNCNCKGRERAAEVAIARLPRCRLPADALATAALMCPLVIERSDRERDRADAAAGSGAGTALAAVTAAHTTCTERHTCTA